MSSSCPSHSHGTRVFFIIFESYYTYSVSKTVILYSTRVVVFQRFYGCSLEDFPSSSRDRRYHFCKLLHCEAFIFATNLLCDDVCHLDGTAAHSNDFVHQVRLL